MYKVVVYSSSFCGFCFRAKALLDKKKISYTDKNVDTDPAMRAEMRSKTGGSTSVPQILINNEPVGGCDDLFALERSGKLDMLLKLA